MNLVDRIGNDMKEAMKAKDSAALSTLRMLRSALKNRQIDLQKELADDDALAVVKSQIKQLKDSLESFEAAGRTETAEAIKTEIALLDRYLPAQMGEEELEAKVKGALEEAGITAKADMGKGMGAAMKAVGGAADGARVKAAVEKLLSGFAMPFLAMDAGQAAFLSEGLQILRVVLMFAGLFAVSQILRGGFTFLSASGRSESHNLGLKTVTGGIVSSLVVFFLFAVATVWIEKAG